VCGSAVLITLIICCTVIALGWISIFGDLVQGFKDLVGVVTGIWSVAKSFLFK